jgi:hypothetical protein
MSGINRRLLERGSLKVEDRLLSGLWPTSADDLGANRAKKLII